MSWTMSSRRTRSSRTGGLAGALALTLVGLVGLTGCGGYSGSDKATASHHKYLILLCQASDIDTVPHDAAFYEQMFLDRKPGQLNVWNYFVDQSYGSSDIEGTVIRGWLKTKKSKDDLLKLRPADAPNKWRIGLSEACVKEFQATDGFKKTTTLTDFKDAGVITIWNLQGTDGGAAGIKIDGVSYPSINAGRGENPGDNSVSFFTHEMLHSLGIKHARGPASAETVPLQLKADSTKDHTFGKNLAEEYGDCWTIMGCGSAVIWTGDDWGNAGPGLGAVHRYQLGWLPSSRVYLFTGPTRTVTLAPSNRPEVAGHLLARIPVNASGPCCDFYTVEYIERSGWNEKIETEKAVLIHEVRKSAPGHTYLVSRSVWGTWVPGQVFTDSANRIRISIDSYGDAAQVTISSGGEPDDGSAKCGFTGYKDNTRSKTAPSVKIESPLNNSHIVAGLPVTLRVAAFDPTIDSGSPSAAPAPDERIHWRLGSGVTKDGRSLTHTFRDPGDRKIEVAVENAYCQSTTKVVLLTVDPPPAATVVILEPVNGQEYLVGPPDFAQTITLTGSGSSSIVTFDWLDSTSTGVIGSGKTLTATVPLKTSTHNCAVEPHVITLRGTTSTGETVTASVTITLKTNCIR